MKDISIEGNSISIIKKEIDVYESFLENNRYFIQKNIKKYLNSLITFVNK